LPPPPAGLTGIALHDCHQSAGNGFIVIQRLARPCFPNQDFKPRK
jgi:hypothetical protein